jgi:hypothetical protein
MHEPSNSPSEPRPRHAQEFEDPHFHDEDESVPADDVEPHAGQPLARRRALRRPPPRRRYYEE